MKTTLMATMTAVLVTVLVAGCRSDDGDLTREGRGPSNAPNNAPRIDDRDGTQTPSSPGRRDMGGVDRTGAPREVGGPRGTAD